MTGSRAERREAKKRVLLRCEQFEWCVDGAVKGRDIQDGAGGQSKTRKGVRWWRQEGVPREAVLRFGRAESVRGKEDFHT